MITEPLGLETTDNVLPSHATGPIGPKRYSFTVDDHQITGVPIPKSTLRSTTTLPRLVANSLDLKDDPGGGTKGVRIVNDHGPAPIVPLHWRRSAPLEFSV